MVKVNISSITTSNFSTVYKKQQYTLNYSSDSHLVSHLWVSQVTVVQFSFLYFIKLQ